MSGQVWQCRVVSITNWGALGVTGGRRRAPNLGLESSRKVFPDKVTTESGADPKGDLWGPDEPRVSRKDAGC